MNVTKHIQKIKAIYQDISTEHDLQIKSVIEEIMEEEQENNRLWEERDSNSTEERYEAEA